MKFYALYILHFVILIQVYILFMRSGRTGFLSILMFSVYWLWITKILIKIRKNDLL